MDINDVKTLTGLTLAEVAAKLDEELPADAYKAVPGGADLTDIDPNHMRRVLNEVFGLCGYGWGYSYNPDDMEVRTETRKTQSGSREVVMANLKHLRFWYRISLTAEAITCEVDASGGSDNSNAAYAMKGAITNAIGNAVSNIGFQESVYLGKRSHKTVGKKPVTRSAAPTQKPVPAPKASVPARQPEDEIEEIEPEVAAPVDSDPADFTISLGQRKGQRLGDQPFSIIEWYATQMATSGDAGKEALKRAAAEYVSLHANGSTPRPTAA
jgi:hypothetical protein